MHSCGLRTGEVRGLRPEDVDLDTGHVTIAEAKGHRSRCLPVTNDVTAVLRSCTWAMARTRSGLRALLELVPPRVAVRRTDGVVEIDPAEVVVGDLVVLAVSLCRYPERVGRNPRHPQRQARAA